MIINNKKLNVEEAIKFSDYNDLLLRHQKNGLILSNYQLDVLKRNGFDIDNYVNIRQLLFDVEEYLDNDYDDELDFVSSQLAEFIYYNETKK